MKNFGMSRVKTTDVTGKIKNYSNKQKFLTFPALMLGLPT